MKNKIIWSVARRPVLLGVAVALAFVALARAATPPVTPVARPKLVLLFVIDGLRPDSITPADTPTIARLRDEGVQFLNTHSAFPTVTRVNAAVISTGAHPGRTGITANTLYDPALNGGEPATTGRAENLWAWAALRGGRTLAAPTLGEQLTAAGLRYVAVSSGSPGQAWLLNPEVRQGSGYLVNGYFEKARRAAFPDAVDATIRAQFGPRPQDAKADTLAWTEQVLRDYILTELKPDVLVDWLTEPDVTQHEFGVGSPEARAALRRVDDNIGQTLARLAALGLLDGTDILITADHGFGHEDQGVNVTDALIKAGLKHSEKSHDITVISDGQALQFHVEGHAAGRIRALVEFLQVQPWADVIFTDEVSPEAKTPSGVPGSGWVPGTFSLQLIHLASAASRPDVVLSLPWTSDANAFGVPGQQQATRGFTGPIITAASGHGGLGPFTIRTPLILWGRSFKQAQKLTAPAGNVDLAPTILALMQVAAVPSDGRVLAEAIAGGPPVPSAPFETKILEVKAPNGYHARLQITTMGDKRYIDQGWRQR